MNSYKYGVPAIAVVSHFQGAAGLVIRMPQLDT